MDNIYCIQRKLTSFELNEFYTHVDTNTIIAFARMRKFLIQKKLFFIVFYYNIKGFYTQKKEIISLCA